MTTPRTREEWLRVAEAMPVPGPTIRGEAFLDSGAAMWRQLEPEVPLPVGGLVVDVGCGHGRMALPLLDRSVEYVGVDVVPEMVAWAAEAFRPWPRVQFHYLPIRNGYYWPHGVFPAEAAQLPIHAESADVVLALSVFTHLERATAARRYLEECARVLRPGGWLVSSWFRCPPNEPSEDAARTAFDGALVDALLHGAGFTVVRTFGGRTAGWGDQWVSLARKETQQVATRSEPSRDVAAPSLVDVVIPAYGQVPLTRGCLESLRRTTVPGQVRALLVDNGSPPEDGRGYHEALAGLPHWYCRLGSNLGFVKATNVGLAASTAPYVLLLNNDTEVPPGWLEKFLEVFEREPRVGVVGPRSSSPHQWQGGIPHDGVWTQPWVRLGAHQMLSFFCALFRREVIVQCGYLSEMYGAGLGDDDEYCALAQQRGWGLALRTDITVLHHHRATFRKVYGDEGWREEQERNLALFKQRWPRAH